MSEDESGPIHRLKRWREGLQDRPRAEFVYRVVVAVIGLAVLIAGIIAIPYPGPGWAIVFLGLAILASEFEWAKRALKFTRERYDQVMDWFKAQGLWVQILGFVVTAAIVVATLWLFGALGWFASLVGLDWPWLQSPLGMGSG